MMARRALTEGETFEADSDQTIYRSTSRACRGCGSDDTNVISSTAIRSSRHHLSDDTASLRPAWRTMSDSVTTTMVRIKHVVPTAPTKRRRFAMVATLIPVTVAVALASFGFLTPKAAQTQQAAPQMAAAVQNSANPAAIGTVVDDTSTLAPADGSASGAVAANALVQSQVAAATSAGSDAGTAALAKAQADLAAQQRSYGSSAADYSTSSTAGTPVAVPDGTFIYPVSGFVMTSPFGWRIHPIRHDWEFHSGVDLAVPCGTPIHASGDGTVSFAGWSGGLGNYVEINSGALSTGYGHQSKIAVTVGQQVHQGDVIGYVGTTGDSTGCHVHFQSINNASGQFFDPTTLIH